ncbi:hypothetical protein L210DRAFT_910294 [Boletus edulis BED1]|uniref:SAP domain-containing protein n=1 Tax=Boletus edulis BED1 TaxID=1328754 RepID=A0AAD4C8Z0_BOLED|nr:hypothetical protein L210DRAFT_910294 [Boletus edulis BED1]
MSTTTQILFNSPALHSLKRDQLVKLCKIHGLKAGGKNNTLIARLRLRARTLPLDDPLGTPTPSDSPDAKPCADTEDEASDDSREGTPINNTLSRPSEQWEVVMDTIAEVDEETLRSRGASDRQVSEFGTTTSKVASVTSSLRAIANSLGLKRNLSKTSGNTSSSSSLSSEVVQSSSTLPTSDPNEPPVEPIPGQSNLQGLPAPSAARLSLSQEPTTTTIRLVSNPATNLELLLSPPKLKPFTTSFDLVPATPGATGSSSVPVWPCSPSGAARESLYPAIPTFGDLYKQQSLQSAQYDSSDMDIDIDMPGGLVAPSVRKPTPGKAHAGARFNTGATPKSSEKPSAEPVDVFSPAPKPQKASIRARLDIPRSEPFVFGSSLPQHNMSNLQFRTATHSVLDEMNKRLAEEGVEAVDADLLNNRRTTTEESVEKQESNGPLRIGDVFEKIHQKEFGKMDSITSHYAAKRGAQSTASQPILSKKRKASLAVKERPSGVPAARHRPNGSRVASGASLITSPGVFSEEGDKVDEVADRRMSKRPRVEREESDAPAQPDRTSIALPPGPEEEAQKQKEREAIRRRLEHNKATRRSSMGRPSLGRAPSRESKAKPARFGFFASAKSLVQNVWNRGAGSKAPSTIPVSKSVQPKGETKTLPRSTEAKKSYMVPTPSLNPPGSSAAANPKSSTVAGYGQSHNRGSSLIGFSSLGRKTGLAANNSRVSSMEAKSNGMNSAANLQKQASCIPRSRTTSTFMAPTASSLARMSNVARIPSSTATHNENSTLTKASSSKQRLAMSPQPGATMEQVTNSPRHPAHSPRPAKIFSQPLSPPPAHAPMSLTAAATRIVSATAKERSSSSVKPSVLPKPKVLAGRRPRISRSKVIARLASQRAAGTHSSASAGTRKAGGKVRSSMSAEAAGKTRQSYNGARGGDMLMSAKKRVRQSEHARRKSRVVSGEEGG